MEKSLMSLYKMRCPVCGKSMQIKGAHYVCEMNEEEKTVKSLQVSYFCDGMGYGTTAPDHDVNIIVRQQGECAVNSYE